MQEIISIDEVSVIRDQRPILDSISWTLLEGQRWVIIGPNGAGKTTLLQLISTQLFPTRGRVRVLGEELGRVNIFELRHRIGMTTPQSALMIPENESVIDVVMTAAYSIIGRGREKYDLWDESRALAMLTTFGVRELKEREFGTLSEGERKRVLIARALMTDPELLLLDEPTSGLDLGGREDLLLRLERFSIDPHAPASVMVTHHIEEIPRGTTHALLLVDGKVSASGPVETVVTSENLSRAYGLSLDVTRNGSRFAARANF